MVRNQRSRRQEESGIALILCLLVLAILIVLITQFAWTAKVERTIARNAKDDLKMLFAARGVVAYAKAHLRADRVTGNAIDSMREDWAQIGQGGDMPPIEGIGDVAITFTMEDCDRYLNVNLLYDPNTKPFAQGVLLKLAEKLQIPNGGEVVERIKDFVDADADGQFEAGARNGLLFHPHELLGMADAQDIPELQAALVGGEDPTTGMPIPGICTYLTTFGSMKINLNTVPDELAWALPLENKPGSGGGPVTDAERDTALEELHQFRTGQPLTGGSSGGSTGGSSSLIQMGVVQGGAQSGTGEGAERPGTDFQNVGELEQKVQLFKGMLGPQTPPQPQPGQPPPPPALRRYIGVTSRDFRFQITAQRGMLTKKAYECILRRGTEEFDILMWREVIVPPEPLPD